MKHKKSNKGRSTGHRRPRFREKRKEDCIYFENAIVVETLPGTTFKAKVKLGEEKNENNKEDDYLYIIANLKTKLIKKRVLIIKGDSVTIEVNPEDMYHDEINKILKGTIIERH